ncbi:hypothetical protein PkP19E3_35635 (plasmid) [Pseudomonas koreensis]|nr:hypothetical protein PkP19E3_35635 [Pseudomonas koreensis]
MPGRGVLVIFELKMSPKKTEHDLDAPVFYNMERMRMSLDSGEIHVPKGLTKEARRRFVREQLSNVANR